MQRGKKKDSARKPGEAVEEQTAKSSLPDVKLSLNPAARENNTAEMAELGKEVHTMLLGYAFMNIVQEDNVHFHHGAWNRRPVDPVRVKSLVKSYKEKGILYWKDPIGVVVPASFVDRTTLVQEPPLNGQGPRLRFTEAAHSHFIRIAGGQHRSAAYQELEQEVTREQQALQVHMGRVGSKRMDEPSRVIALAKLQQSYDELERVRQSPKIWLVAVYASGTLSMPTCSEPLNLRIHIAENFEDRHGHFISRNEETPTYQQTTLERFWLVAFALRDRHRQFLSSTHKPAQPAPIGSAEWSSEVVTPLLTPSDVAKGFGPLFKEPVAWDFIMVLLELPHMRDGKHVTFNDLKQRLQVVDSSSGVSKHQLDSHTGKMLEVRPSDTAGGVRVTFPLV